MRFRCPVATRRAGPIVVLAALSSAVAAAGEEVPGLRSWAVLASATTQQSGVSDLVAVELSRVEGVQLVEREQWGKIAEELELSAMFGAKATAGRLALGKRLKADALILMDQATQDGKPVLRVAVLDCRYGARLRMAWFPWSDGGAEAAVKEVVALALEARSQFARGIRRVIGVSPMVSKNLGHQYDHLQSGYAHLLENALMGTPGVAVLEIEEAHAVAEELASAGAEVRGRRVPLFVEGEFEMASGGGAKVPRVSVRILIRDGRRVLKTIGPAEMEMGAVAGALTTTVAREVLRAAESGDQAPASPEEQGKLLGNRGGRFEKVGMWDEAAGLREAAILIRPDDLEQRLTLIADYRQAIQRSRFEYQKRPKSHTPEDLKAVQQENLQACKKAGPRQLRRWRRMLALTDELVHRRVLNPGEATWLIRACISPVDYLEPWTGRADFLPAEVDLEKERQEFHDFLRSAYGAVRTLDPSVAGGAVRPIVRVYSLWIKSAVPDPTDPREQLRRWVDDAIVLFMGGESGRHVAAPRSLGPCPPLAGMSVCLTEIVPPDAPLAYGLNQRILVDIPRFIQAGVFRYQDVESVYQRLAQSKSEMNAFYGRCGLLTLRIRFQPDGKPRDLRQGVDPEEFKELDELMRFLPQRGYDRRAKGFGPLWYIQLERLHKELEHFAPRTSVPPAPAARKRHSAPPDTITAHASRPRVRYQKIEGFNAFFLHLRKCGDNLDVAWTTREVFLRPSKEVVRPVFRVSGEKTKITAVEWDGRNVWIVCNMGPLNVLPVKGRALQAVGTENGLPSLAGLRLYACAPGRAIVYGVLGPDRRVWVADVARPEGRSQGPFRATVIHKCIERPDDSAGGDGRPEDIFFPGECFEYHCREPQQRLLLIQRAVVRGRRLPPYPTPGRAPLAIDLKTRTASLFSTGLFIRANGPGSFRCQNLPLYCLDDGRILYTFSQRRETKIDCFTPPKKAGDAWTRSTLFTSSGIGPRQFVEWQGAVYQPGRIWVRVDPKTLRCEQLNSDPLSDQYPDEHFAVSAHDGLIAYNHGDASGALGLPKPNRGWVYRVLIDPAGAAGQDVQIPAEFRAKHEQAVKAIRQLGGKVGEATRVDPRTARVGFVTHVYLGKDWKGGDAGMAHLADLYRLGKLHLVGAPVGNEGLKQVRLQDLTSLVLYETKVTDAGLAVLAACPQLEDLRLEGTLGGKELSDAGLEHLRRLAGLKTLWLYGPGFTDRALDVLKTCPSLVAVTLCNTAVTRRAIAHLLLSGRRMRITTSEDR